MEEFSDRGRTLVTIVDDDELERERIEELLRDLGADETLVEKARRRMRDVDVREVVAKFRSYAQENPAVVLGALSALVLGGAAAAGRAVKKARNASARRRSAASASRTTSSNKAPRRTAAKKSPRRASSSKRTLIEPHPGDKRYIRRDARGRIKESDDVGRSLAADRRRKSKKSAKRGQGDKGD